MSAKSIREFDGKCLVSHYIGKSPKNFSFEYQHIMQLKSAAQKLVRVKVDTKDNYNTEQNHLDSVKDTLKACENIHPWLKLENTKLVVKPDQLIKRRGKSGLLAINVSWEQAKAWIIERAGKVVQVEHVSGPLTNFLVEPFCPHKPEQEYYVCINTSRYGDQILFTHEGGVDVGDVDQKAKTCFIPIDEKSRPSREGIASELLENVDESQRGYLTDFICQLYDVFVDLNFTYLEINPLVVIPQSNSTAHAEVFCLDMAAKIDQTAEFESGNKWAFARSSNALGYVLESTEDDGLNTDHGPPMEFPAPFGRVLSPEEEYIASLDAKTGASLKLTILNSKARVWTLVAGGGASVVYSDAIVLAGGSDSLANYGEYSGAPTETQTYEYAKTVLNLMLRGEPLPDGKILIIGGGIANFTNVATTFKGIIRALREFKTALQSHNVQIWVRRAGPNYEEGLRSIRALAPELNVPLHVHGPETHVSGIVPLALRN